MTKRNIFERIRGHKGRLSPSRKKLADMLANRYGEVVNMTSHDLAEELGISASTVVRFASDLGYDGYPAMLEDLRDTVLMISETPMKKLRESFTNDEPIETLLGKVVLHETSDIDHKRFAQSGEAFIAVANAMISARHIYLTGARSSYCTVHYAGYMLSNVSSNVSFFSSSAEQRYEYLENISKEDVVVAVSFHRYYKQTIELAEFAKKGGAFTVGITDSPSSPIVPHCTETLMAPSNLPFSSYVPAMILMDALILAFTQSKGEAGQRMLDSRMKTLLENDLYAEI